MNANTFDFDDAWLASLKKSDLNQSALLAIYRGTRPRHQGEDRDAYLRRVRRSIGGTQRRTRARQADRERKSSAGVRAFVRAKRDPLTNQPKTDDGDVRDLLDESPEGAAARNEFRTALTEDERTLLAALLDGRRTAFPWRKNARVLASLQAKARIFFRPVRIGPAAASDTQADPTRPDGHAGVATESPPVATPIFPPNAAGAAAQAQTTNRLPLRLRSQPGAAGVSVFQEVR